MTRFAFLLLALSSVLSFALAETHLQKREHGRLAARGQQKASGRDWKRTDGARFTFYNVQTGNQVACGGFYKNTDYIVALNVEQWAGGANCFKQITLQYQGKSVSAQIVDQCPTCPYGALDLAPSLFQNFASEAQGEVYGSWDFGSGASPTTTKKATTTSHSTTTWKPSTTSTWSTSTTKLSTSSSSWSSSSSSWSSSSSSWSTSSTASASATASAALIAPSALKTLGAIENLDMAIVQVGGIVAAGAQQAIQLYN